MSTPTKRILALVVFLVFAVGQLITFSTPAFAQTGACNFLSGVGVTLPVYEPGMTHTITISVADLDPSMTYYIKIKAKTVSPFDEVQTPNFKITHGTTGHDSQASWSVENGILTLTINDEDALTSKWLTSGPSDTHYVELLRHEGGSNRVCSAEYTTPVNSLGGNCTLKVYQLRGPGCTGSTPTGSCQQCYSGGSAGCSAKDVTTKVEVAGLTNANQPYSGNVTLFISGQNGGSASSASQTISNGSGALDVTFFDPDNYTIQAKGIGNNGASYDFPNCATTVTISDTCNDTDPASCETTPVTAEPGQDLTAYMLCDQIDRDQFDQQYQACVDCVGGAKPEDQEGVWTAIGCIKREPAQIAQALIKLGLMMGGGVALLMMLVAGFILSVSQGDPKRIEDARDMVTASFMGLIFIIFSVTILQFIGFSILRIPGFGG